MGRSGLNDDENAVNSIWEFFLDSQENWEIMLQEIYQYKDDLPAEISVLLFSVLGNIFHTMSLAAFNNYNIKFEEQSSLESALMEAQIAVISDPNFEKALNELMPKFMVNRMFRGGE